MRVIGITGPTGAGKTTVLQALESLGGVLIDADAVYHDLTRSSQAMQAELVARFGPVYDGNELDRKKLGAVVFQDENALADLNRITHKYIARETQRRIEAAKAAGATAVGIDAIGLLESQLVDFCDCTLAVTAPPACGCPPRSPAPGFRPTATTPSRARRPTRWRPPGHGPRRSLRRS